MATVSEVKEALDITTARWNKYINEGVIRKEKVGHYDIYDVAKQLIRHQASIIKKHKTEKSVFTVKTTRLEKRLAEALSTDGLLTDEDGNVIEKPMTRKEKLDLQLLEERLFKMQHEREVRKKNYMPVDNVFEFITGITSEFAAFLEPIVGKIKQIVPDMNARTHDELVKMIAVGRNNLSRHIEGKTTNEFIQLFNPEEDQASIDATEDSRTTKTM